ncbi:hypothetical protein BH24ACT5_BH24ACT5_03780 [soil metagenome]
MERVSAHWRYSVALLSALILFQAGAVSPASVLADEPSASPGLEIPEAPPASDPAPSPSTTPIPPDNTEVDPADLPPPPVTEDPPGVERIDLRTAYSRSFEQPDGKRIVELYSEPVFYQPDGSTDWAPIELTFADPAKAGAVASVSKSAAQISLFTADAPAGFVTLDGGGHSISFGLPDGVSPGREGAGFALVDNGTYAELPDFLPGGIALRIFPHADGFKSFLILPDRPPTDSFTFAIDSDLALADEKDGSFTFRDAEGNVAGRIPRPYLLDSSELEGRGGGLYSEAVTQTVTQDGERWLLTLSVDPKVLDEAVYPVYLDPTTTTFPTGSTTANDTFASEKYPNSNFNTYQRPDSPFYKEMWHGQEPGTSFYNEVYIRFNDLEATLGSTHIDSASLQFYPYWQYYHYQWRPSWVERVAADWDAGTLKWNNKPATDFSYGSQDSKEGVWSDFDVKAYVQDVVNGTVPNHGLMLHANDTGQGDWKRIVSRNDGSNLKPKLVVTVTPFVKPAVFYPNSATGETSTRTVQWTLPAGASQGAYDIQVDRDQVSAYDYDSGTVPGATPAAMVPNSTSLIDGQLYYWRVKVKYGNNSSFSGWSSWAPFVYRQGATLGLPSFNTFESFPLGNGDSASVNVSTANLVISHPIVALPIRGGAFGLGLTYNSQSSANAGTGPGWRLNAMRRLAALGNGNVVLTAGDGSVHTFTNISTVGTVTTYTRPSTVYGTLRKDTANALEWTLTYRDQSVDSFDQSGSEGLLARQADRFGNAVTFSYSAGTNRLAQATDPNGRVVDFAWNTGVSPARLTSITDWAYVSSGIVQTTNTGSRRQYRFFYDAGGNLIGWSNPLNTSGSCPTQGSNLTCLTYDANNGLVATIKKRLTPAAIVSNAISTGTAVDPTAEITYRGGEVSQAKYAEQSAASPPVPGTTFTRIAADQVEFVRQGTPASTTTYVLLSATDSLARVQSTKRRLGVSTDIEQRTTWNATYPSEPASIADNYGAGLSTPARTASYTYVGNSMGLVSVMTDPLTGATNRTTTYTYNANNDVTQVVVSSGGSSTTTRHCYTTSGCATSGNVLTLNSVIENYTDGSKGGANGNDQDVTTDYLYDSYGQRTRETRWNYDSSGNLLDSRSIGYTHDANGNQTAFVVNYADGAVSGSGDDVTPNVTTGARTDLTSAFTYDTAGNQVSSADPRRAIGLALGQGLNADDYVARSEFDALNQQTRSTAPRDPADGSAPRSSTTVYDELGAMRQSTDFGGLVSATKFDRAGRALETYEDPPEGNGPPTPAYVSAAMTYDAAGRVRTAKDRNQVGDSSLGVSATTYDELGRTTAVTEASGSPPNFSSTTDYAYDALDRQVSMTVGGVQTTSTTYDLGGRSISVNDGFACTTSTYDYRDLALTDTSGLTGGTCASGSETRTVTHSYDGLGRRTRSAVTAGADSGDWLFAATLDSAGRQLTSAVKTGGVTSTTTFTLNPLDQVLAETRPDGTSAKNNYDAAGNQTDSCYWKPGIAVGSCYPQGTSPWTNPPTQVTTSAYDARNNRISLVDSTTGATTTYDPEHNYAIKAFYVETGSSREHQTLYVYDTRHRVTTITHQLCALSSGHSCSSTTATGSDSYSYDDNDNRTQVGESNGEASSTHHYCYDALNRLQYRKTGTNCSGTTNETYTYNAAGNRTQMVVGGVTTNFGYNPQGQLCKVGGNTCTGANVTYDTAGRTKTYNGWAYEYDAEGRLVRACESSSCATSGVDKIEFTYDGEGHRTQIKEYTAGTLTKTTDLRYQGNAIIQETTDTGFGREYVVDDARTVIKFCDPNCASPMASYLVTWNGHGDAMAIWRIKADGSLEIANSFTYSTWGSPTVKSDHINSATSQQYGDLGFRFLYVGAYDVQWDNFSGLDLHYMHARHYAPAIGRFLQPDPSRMDTLAYSYADNNPVSKVDPSGTVAIVLVGVGMIILTGLALISSYLLWYQAIHGHALRISIPIPRFFWYDSAQQVVRNAWQGLIGEIVVLTLMRDIFGRGRVRYHVRFNTWLGLRIQDVCIYRSAADPDTRAQMCLEVKTGGAQYWFSAQHAFDKVILIQFGVPVVPVRVLW